MKKLLITCLFLLSFCFANAQQKGPDKIQKKDKSVINAIVVEISSKEIKYKKYQSPNGATFSVPTKEVSTILYSDGYIEILDEPPPVLAKSTTQERVTDEKKPAPTTVSTETSTPKKETPTPVASVSTNTSTEKDKKTDVVAKTSKGGYKLTGKELGLELPPREVSGLDIDRVPFAMLEKDLRHPSEYDGEYQWKSSAHDQKGTVWRIEWDNVTLIPKEWMGYGWQRRANSEKDIKLKDNELRSNGKLMGYFVKFNWKGQEVRGFYIQTANNRDLFLLKVK
ncbi:hypothetical protein QNI19_28755 [Cytophagaceae bacterium DM2B3-1]|uniref:Uncharacterized protein n=1 Tax=Xanthocytophaga flava TaxID=3048013 RepID=A0ABT7CTF7_9BACT|nr:hypothetical protein [Xanthocytophaga flavus]MDJ1472177.1 hypothetical protein [Xanthocytophaga flavus]MDJ1496961.1 hypothetical protein [Xanthocytophaga flavus]